MTGFKKIRNIIVIFLLILVLQTLQTLTTEHQIHPSDGIMFQQNENVTLTEQISFFHSSKINARFYKTGHGPMNLMVTYSKFVENNDPIVREVVLNKTAFREFKFDWILDNSGIFEITLNHIARVNSTSTGKFRYIIEWQRISSVQMFLPVIVSALLVLGFHFLDRYGRISWQLSDHFLKSLRSSKFYLILKYYWRPFVNTNSLLAFYVISIFILDPTNLPTSPQVRPHEIRDTLKANLFFISIYWLYFLIIGSRIFSREFSQIAFEWTYPINRQTLWLTKIIYLTKEIILTNLILVTYWILIRYVIFMQLYYVPLISILQTIITLGLITLSWVIFLPILSKLNFDKITSVSLIMMVLLGIENSKNYSMFIPYFGNIEDIIRENEILASIMFSCFTLLTLSNMIFRSMGVSNE